MKRVRECGGLRVLHLEGCHLRSASSRSARSDAARFDELDTSSRALKNVLTRSGLRGRSPTPAAIAQGWVVREESTKNRSQKKMALRCRVCAKSKFAQLRLFLSARSTRKHTHAPRIRVCSQHTPSPYLWVLCKGSVGGGFTLNFTQKCQNVSNKSRRIQVMCT